MERSARVTIRSGRDAIVTPEHQPHEIVRRSRRRACADLSRGWRSSRVLLLARRPSLEPPVRRGVPRACPSYQSRFVPAPIRGRAKAGIRPSPTSGSNHLRSHQMPSGTEGYGPNAGAGGQQCPNRSRRASWSIAHRRSGNGEGRSHLPRRTSIRVLAHEPCSRPPPFPPTTTTHEAALVFGAPRRG